MSEAIAYVLCNLCNETPSSFPGGDGAMETEGRLESGKGRRERGENIVSEKRKKKRREKLRRVKR